MGDERFSGLKDKLGKSEFPLVYMFKFIMPNDNRTLALVQSLFGSEAQITMNSSRTGRYISVSAKELMLNVDSIIDRYIAAAKIEGVIAL